MKTNLKTRTMENKEYHKSDIKFAISADYINGALKVNKITVESQLSKEIKYDLPLNREQMDRLTPILVKLTNSKDSTPKEELEAYEAMRYIAIATHNPLQAINAWKNRDETKITTPIWVEVVEKYIYNRAHHSVANRHKPKTATLGGVLAARVIQQQYIMRPRRRK